MNEKLKNIMVEEFTSPCPDTIDVNTTAQEIIKIMDEHDYRHLPVTNEGRVVGIISQRDIINVIGRGFSAHVKASDIMTEHPYMVTENTPIEEVAFTMSENKIGCALVIDESQCLSGIFTTTDALNALVEVVRGEI